MSRSKFEIRVEVPEPTSMATRYLVSCGHCTAVLIQQKDRETKEYNGFWLPEFDWREMYTLADNDRHGFALPFRTMLRLTKEHLIKCETRRQIEVGARKVAV